MRRIANHVVRLFVIGVAGLCLAGCKEVLFSRLSEAQANEVLAALSQARIGATKTRLDGELWQVDVESAEVGHALVYLRNRGLPTQPAPNLGEVFKKDGLISSPMEERARYASALQEGIAATLRRIDGVADARVHVAIPQNDPLSNRIVPASAAVFIKHLPSLDIEMLTPSIKSMVMASVEGLDYRNITLVSVRADGDAPRPPAQNTPARSASFMSAQAAGLAEPVVSSVPGAALHERLLAAAAGFGMVAVAGWGVLRRRRANPPPRARAAPPTLVHVAPARTTAEAATVRPPTPARPVAASDVFGTVGRRPPHA